MPTRLDLCAAARTYIGVRFHHQGRCRAGLDCSGLIVCAAMDCGVELVDRVAYSRQPDGHSLEQAMVDAGCERIPIATAGAGDVLMFSFQDNEIGEPLPAHLGIIDVDGDLIHAYTKVRRVTKHNIDDAWRARITSAWRLPGFEEVA